MQCVEVNSCPLFAFYQVKPFFAFGLDRDSISSTTKIGQSDFQRVRDSEGSLRELFQTFSELRLIPEAEWFTRRVVPA
ncbi:hypothetical protein KTH_49130 [Thermosporothrix hazakensis]|nr:hypothetical protein KTH_49130 [Thermosporothrix hazakensis]